MNNAITWFEIPAVNFDRAVNFYSTILNQPLRKGEFGGIPHGFFPSDETGVSGAIVLNPHYETRNQGVVIYLNTGNDLEGVMSRVESCGGKVLMPVTDITPQGFMALIEDSEGNRVGLHQPPMN
jgi:uncharacterized protein